MPESMVAIIELVQVLPCVPATATVDRPPARWPSIRARGQIGMPRRIASTTSGLVSGIAEETTTTSGVPRFSARWPMATGTPARLECARVARLLQVAAGDASPRSASTSAMPLMPAPPAPMKCA